MENAFVLLADFQRQAKRAGWTKEEIQKVIEEATSSDYDHLCEEIYKQQLTWQK